MGLFRLYQYATLAFEIGGVRRNRMGRNGHRDHGEADREEGKGDEGYCEAKRVTKSAGRGSLREYAALRSGFSWAIRRD